MKKRLLTLSLLAALASAAPATAQAPAQPEHGPTPLQAGIAEGQTTAETVGTGMWTLGGFAGGSFFGPIGAVLAYSLAGGSASELPTPLVSRMSKKEAAYQLGFQQAYTDRLKARRKNAALVGGMTGTALLALSCYAAAAMVR